MRRSALFLGILLVLAPGCGGDSDDDYNASVKASFVEACAAGLGDDGSTTCGCAFDRIARRISFDRFAKLDDEIRKDPDADLPREIASIIRACAEPDPTTTTTEG